MLPAVSLGLWQNFGDEGGIDAARAMLRRAFDLGITHFDLANNYGTPAGSAERNFGQVLVSDLTAHRDELIISTKAGYRMWPGPYGEWGSRKYLLASLDQSLRRMRLDYVDIFYAHRPDASTPLEETMGALDHAVRAGKALYAGVSNYPPAMTREAAAILRRLGTPCLVHQPSYSMLNRWVEKEGLLALLEEEGMGCIAFSPVAQGLLTDRYLGEALPQGSRAESLPASYLSPDTRARLNALHEIARARGQSLAQMALAWVLTDARVTSVLTGASRKEQIEDCVRAVGSAAFGDEELAAIDAQCMVAGDDLLTQLRRG
jgi:L-glyceraldehyde 3-phosphate reductase